MEFILHYAYVVAIKDTSAWYDDSVAELSMIGFWNLIIVWLKVKPPHYDVKTWLIIRTAPYSLEILPVMGTARRYRPSRKHGPLHGQQLFRSWLLAKLAP